MKHTQKEKCCLPIHEAVTQKQCNSRTNPDAFPFLYSVAVLHQSWLEDIGSEAEENEIFKIFKKHFKLQVKGN